MTPDRASLAQLCLMCAEAEAIGPIPAQDASGAPRPLPPSPPWVLAGQWRLAGWITALDALFKVGPIAIDSRRVQYGWAIENSPGDFIVVIRGTSGAVEWLEDGDGVPVPYPGGGSVERGFYELAQSLWLRPVAGVEQPLIAGLKADGAQTVTFMGHSLGAAMASIASLDAADAGLEVRGRYFESPRPGDAEFARAFDAKVSDYVVVRYEPDLVPDLPPLGFSPLSKMLTIPRDPAICDNPLCNHHAQNIAWLLDKTSTSIVSGCAATG
jgi:triacylglycerol lipase